MAERDILVEQQPPPQYRVFINFRGAELRLNFVSHLEKRLKKEGVNAFVDRDDGVGKSIGDLQDRIAESRMALAIFSSRYTESKPCLKELVKIKECVEGGRMRVIPIFYKLDTETVKRQKGEFGDKFRDLARSNPDSSEAWTQALEWAPTQRGFSLDHKSDEGDFITKVTENVKKVLNEIEAEERRNHPVLPEMLSSTRVISTVNGESKPGTLPLFGIKPRFKRLQEKLQTEPNKTRVLGVVGMPGIGKTTLAKELFHELKGNFVRHMLFLDIRTTSKAYELDQLQERLVRDLLNCAEDEDIAEIGTEWMDYLLKTKVLVVLDDVSDKKQIEVLLGGRSWIKEGSRIVITTSDKSLIEGMVDDTYVVPGLDDRDGLEQFSYYAFDDHICSPKGNFMKLSRKFVDYARGNPLALKVLGSELRGKDETHWESKLGTLTQSPNKTIQDVLRISYDGLSQQQKDVFLDIACFFRSEDEYYVRSLLDSSDPESADAAGEIRDLANKFLINVSGGQVEMYDLLYTFGKQLASQASVATNGLGRTRQRRLLNFRDISVALRNKAETANVRGLSLDMSEVTNKVPLCSESFTKMHQLRYLKFFSSRCHLECEDDIQINFPEGLKFPLEELRCLHWYKFPLEEFPQDFNPKNLIDLKLPYSKIEQVWDGVKDTSNLKWVDLNHSSKLRNLTGLLGARNLQRLNLEGCTALAVLSQRMQNMSSLVYLNLRGCTGLQSLPEMKLTSLKTLVLSGCSKLRRFQVISQKLETLYLDGTAITTLPPAIGDLDRLTLLNLKNCKTLCFLPDCLGRMKALQEIILSGCSKLKSFPEIKENMSCLEILLLDGTAIEEMPKLLRSSSSEVQVLMDISLPPCSVSSHPRDLGLCEWPRSINGLTSLRRLCLSGNQMIRSLQANISQLYHLRWLDLKNCKNLRSIAMLPQNLQCLDAHGCDSLETVASPLALLALTAQIHSTFIFTNCEKLDQVAKNSIISNVRRKSQLISDALDRYNVGFASEALVSTCFPGCEVPAWFTYQAIGSVMEPKLPPHWCENRLNGIVLCAVVSFQDYQDQSNRVLVKCKCEFKKEDGSRVVVSCTVGSNEPLNIKSDHVFIGYTSCSHIAKSLENQCLSKCVPTEASLEFKVTDGASEVVRGEVLKCGFSLVYAEANSVAGERNCTTTPKAHMSRRVLFWGSSLMVVTVCFIVYCFLLQMSTIYLTVNLGSFLEQPRTLG